ncbi:MAG TPA: molybdopterin cofactor-binding domain-containing protein [Steroidobacteraceae bacterium]|nr:molybdopterin cofactor-binding domain-containing protein [Steroidobacteraceae bacterium]
MPDAVRRESLVVTRREFIRAAAAIGGGLALTLDLQAQEGGAPPAMRPHALKPPSAFIQISADNTITIVTPAVEMGQGGHTAMPMIIMDELDGDWERLRVLDAPAAPVYDNPMMGQQATVGSFSVRGWYAELRRVGAAAREMLVQAAAKEWEVPANECSVSRGTIAHRPTRRRCTFGSVAVRAAGLPVPQQPTLKASGDFTIIGTSPRRVDIAAKVDGSAHYGIDIRLPDMLYAAIKACPTFGGKIRSFDDSAAKQMPGYRATVALPDAIIVVARSYWQARKALDTVEVQYDLGRLASLDSAEVSRRLRAGITEPGEVVRHDGNVQHALAGAATVLEAVYEVPYLAHACMEPMNCTVRGDSEACEVWCGTQMPQAAQAAAAAVFGLPASRVTVHTQYLGGGFGRRGQADYVAQAAAAAKAVGRPVKLVWTREEDIQHDFYRPAAAIRFRGGIDSTGRLVALECNVATSSAPDFGGPARAAFYTGGVSDTTYAIPNVRVSGVNKDIGIRFGFWRSVNDSHNPFMLEGFIDEVAHHLQQDPYRFRRSMLQHPDGRRQLAVLDLIAAKAGWDHPAPGHFFGISAFAAFGSFIGTVAEVSVKDKFVTLHRVVSAIDCGVAIHPDNIQAQLEGGMVYGLTAALRGEITLEHGAVRQSNFNDYPVLMLADMPRFECYIVPSTAPPSGVGEPGTAPIAPALGNAIYAATGERVRSLPLSKYGFTLVSARA